MEIGRFKDARPDLLDMLLLRLA